MNQDREQVILDTNVFVAAGFNRGSASARIIETVRSGAIALIWSDETFRETRHIIRKIPPLSWEPFAALFREENRFTGATDPHSFGYVTDPDDRKFAALAAASGATLISSDDDLLSVRERLPFRLVTPSEYSGSP
jgi:putative PIN family toxin of toxin-antitoxin system